MMREGKPVGAPPARHGGNASVQESEALVSGAMHAKAGQAIARVDTGVVTAIQVALPRRLDVVKVNALAEVEMLGEDYYYEWEVNDRNSPTGKSLIAGMSIDGAMVLYSNWCNCAYTVDVADETPTHWTFQATFVDWERGVTFPRLFRQRKSQNSSSKMEADRAQDIAFQIGQSKAIRNAIDKAMPEWLKREAMSLAHNAAVNKYKDVPKSIWDLCVAAKKWGITPAELMAKVGKEFVASQDDKGKWRIDPKAWLSADVATMFAVLRAIEQRQTTVEIEFRGAARPDAAGATAPEAEGAAAAPPADQSTAGGQPVDDGGVDWTTAAPPAPAPGPTPAAPPPVASAPAARGARAPKPTTAAPRVTAPQPDPEDDGREPGGEGT